MNVLQLLKITRKFSCWNIDRIRKSKEYAHDNNKKKLKQSETNLAIWFRLLSWRQQIKLNKVEKMKVESMTNYFWKRNFFVCQQDPKWLFLV